MDPDDPNTFVGNPPVRFPNNYTPNIVVDTPQNSLEVINREYYDRLNYDDPVQDVLLLRDLDDAVCAGLVNFRDYEGPVFGRAGELFSCIPFFVRSCCSCFLGNEIWIHNPTMEIVENTDTSPATDGGGEAFLRNLNVLDIEGSMQCANVPRSFMNEDTCELSTSPSACQADYRRDSYFEVDLPEAYVRLTPEALRQIYLATKEEGSPVYVYAVDGLDIREDQSVSKPCERETISVWRSVPCSGASGNVDSTVHAIFQELIDFEKVDLDDEYNNEYFLELWYPPVNDYEISCPEGLMTISGFEVEDSDGDCWLSVHPDTQNVYDFTAWVRDHPGNNPSTGFNPIQAVAENGDIIVNFPQSHEMGRWAVSEYEFPGGGGRLGDMVNFYDFPRELQTTTIAQVLGVELADPGELTTGHLAASGSGTLICGSVNEVSNDLLLDGSKGAAGFEFRFYDEQEELYHQRSAIWLKAAMEDPGQLRQRVAWALSQIFVVSLNGVEDGDFLTEAFLQYYDIFVRNAFGNYRDILQEVSYSPLMADMLTYFEGRSTAYVFEQEGNVEFADENYAREIMQLFTTGLVRLNGDGTTVRDGNGLPIRVYTNDEIRMCEGQLFFDKFSHSSCFPFVEEYARAWTGFSTQQPRGVSIMLLSCQVVYS